MKRWLKPSVHRRRGRTSILAHLIMKNPPVRQSIHKEAEKRFMNEPRNDKTFIPDRQASPAEPEQSSSSPSSPTEEEES